jgi:hypothetical protein
MKHARVPHITAVYWERVLEPGAMSAEQEESKQTFECDLCGEVCNGSPFSSGLMVWFRGDEMRIDEPPLCEDCSSRVTMGAVAKWASEGEEEG